MASKSFKILNIKSNKKLNKQGFIMLFIVTSISLLFTTFIIMISEKQFILLNKQKTFTEQRKKFENDYNCINSYIQDAINVYYNIEILSLDNYNNCNLKNIYKDNNYLYIVNNSIKVQHKFMFSPQVL